MLRKTKTIKEIYKEAEGYDLVITNDAPLATALNKLVEKSRLGYLAMTPKQIAKKFAGIYYEKLYDKFDIILSLYKKNNLPLNLLHQTVKKIYEIWMYNAKFEFIPVFLSEEENRILKLIAEYETLETVMENFNEEYYRDKKIAVIGEELFTLLDLEVLIKRGAPVDKIELFKEDEYNIETTYVFRSDEMLAENIADLITEENADETAIVLNTESEYLEIIKAQLSKRGLKTEDKNFLKDDLSVRTFISFIDLSMDINNLEFREFIPLANEFGISTKTEFSNYNAGNYIVKKNKDSRLRSLYDLCTVIRKITFKDLLKKLSNEYDYKVNPVFTEMLEISELYDSVISDNSISDLKYLIKEFDIETTSEKSGILFVNAMNSAYIDRKIVFYIGLDDSWMRIYPDKDYLKKEDEEEKNRLRFQILIQQGDQKYYFVRNTKDFEDVIPCYYFSILSGKKADSFNDEYFNPVYISSSKASEKYIPVKENIAVMKPVKYEDISPTSLNAFFRCPKLYSLRKIFPNEENQAMKKGNLFHSYAELYFNHPEFAVKNFDEILNLMVSEMSYFVKRINVKFVKTEFRIGAESIMKFINDAGIEKTALSEPVEKTYNFLMDKFNLKKIYSNSERWIRGNEKNPIKGKMDLQYGNTIVDYKSTASRKSESEITYQSNLSYIENNQYEKFDFQAVAYISHLRERSDDVEFIYNYLLSNFRNQLNQSAGEKECLTKIQYRNVTFHDYIRGDEFFEMLILAEKPGRLLYEIGRDKYLLILDNLGLENHEFFDKDKLYNTFIERANYVIDECGYNYRSFKCQKQDTFNENFIKPVAVKIYKARTGSGEYGSVFREDCDAFVEFAGKKLAEINEYSRTNYPPEPFYGSRDICKGCEYLNLCTGNKLWH